jgi:hypothetical protein
MLLPEHLDVCLKRLAGDVFSIIIIKHLVKDKSQNGSRRYLKSVLKKNSLFVFLHEHLDIGLNGPPDDVNELCCGGAFYFTVSH